MSDKRQQGKRQQGSQNGQDRYEQSVTEAFLNSAQKRRLFFYRPFWLIGGAHPSLLKQFPTDWDKYFGAGTAILMTATFAAFSGGYAFSTIFQDMPEAAIGFGLVWGLFILLLDRYFVISMVKKPGDKFQSGFWIALPRIILGVFIGIIVARPLELRIAQAEIDAFLGQDYIQQKTLINEEYDSRILATREDTVGGGRLMAVNARIPELQDRKDELEDYIYDGQVRVDTLFALMECECRGACGTGKFGDGPNCKDRRRRYQDAQRDFRKEKSKWDNELDQIETELTAVSTQRDTIMNSNIAFQDRNVQELEQLRLDALADLEKNNKTSLINRNRALGAISNNNFDIWLMVTVISFLFIMIEIAPVLIKLFSNYGPYDGALAAIAERGELQAKGDRDSFREKDIQNRLDRRRDWRQSARDENRANWSAYNRNSDDYQTPPPRRDRPNSIDELPNP